LDPNKGGVGGDLSTDLRVLDGTRDSAVGRISGHEVAGWVDEGSAKGTPVVVFPLVPCGQCPSCDDGQQPWECGRPEFLGVDYNGAFCGYVNVRKTPFTALILNCIGKWRHIGSLWRQLGGEGACDAKTLVSCGSGGRGRISHLTKLLLQDAQVEAVLVDEDTASESLDAVVECWCDLTSMMLATRVLKHVDA
jgi:hypothetical protein